MNTLLNVVEGEVLKAIYGVVGFILMFLIKEVISYVKNKKQAEAVKLGVDTYNAHLTVAKNIFNQAKSFYKLIPGSGSLKATMFDKLLLAKFPKLSQIQIDHCREAIYGSTLPIVNEILAPVYNPLTDESNVKIEADKIPEETKDPLPLTNSADLPLNTQVAAQ